MLKLANYSRAECQPVCAVPWLLGLLPPDHLPLDPLDLVQVLLEGGGDDVGVEVSLLGALDAEDLEVDRLRSGGGRRRSRCSALKRQWGLSLNTSKLLHNHKNVI